MKHQNGRRKLNLKSSHKRSLLRNQTIHLISYGSLISTKANVKAVQQFAERLVTIARVGNDFNSRRRAKQMLPYHEPTLVKLFKEIAPHYVNRAGGYTRVISLGRRMSDTAPIARLEWV